MLVIYSFIISTISGTEVTLGLAETQKDEMKQLT